MLSSLTVEFSQQSASRSANAKESDISLEEVRENSGPVSDHRHAKVPRVERLPYLQTALLKEFHVFPVFRWDQLTIWSTSLLVPKVVASSCFSASGNTEFAWIYGICIHAHHLVVAKWWNFLLLHWIHWAQMEFKDPGWKISIFLGISQHRQAQKLIAQEPNRTQSSGWGAQLQRPMGTCGQLPMPKSSLVLDICKYLLWTLIHESKEV